MNIQGSRMLRGKQHAGCWGCPESPAVKQGSSLEFPSPPQYLLLILLLHGPEMLVPLLVHFQQLRGRDWGGQEISRERPERANSSNTSFAGVCSVRGRQLHTLPRSCASQKRSSKQITFINRHILPLPGRQD